MNLDERVLIEMTVSEMRQYALDLCLEEARDVNDEFFSSAMVILWRVGASDNGRNEG